MSEHIAAQAGLCGWLAYSPPPEIGQGRQVSAYGQGGFAIWNGNGDRRSAPRLTSGRAKPLSFNEARQMAEEIDRWLAFDHGETCAGWVEAIIADLPNVLAEAISTADRRTGELRIMKAAVTGDVT